MDSDKHTPLESGPESKGQKKQVLLRISPELYNKLQAWAEDEFRSLNGQIEYLLNECVKHREKRN